MCGVIIDGQQFERCNGCQEWVRIEELLYEPPTRNWTYGRDLCEECADESEYICEHADPILVVIMETEARHG